MLMMKWLPLWLVDKILLILAWFILGNTEKWGLKRPSVGPLELKNTQGKTPVLDVGALQKIRSGEIKVVPGIKRFSSGAVELINGEKIEIDSVVLATGYRSNVPYWLQVRKLLHSSVYSLRETCFRKWKTVSEILFAVYFPKTDLVSISIRAGKRILLGKRLPEGAIPKRVERKGWSLCCWVHKKRALWCIL